MRDLKDYQNKYKDEPGERIQVKYRRRHVISIMERYPHRNIIEVGCGLEPLFLYYTDFDTMTVVEPGEMFYKNAEEKASQEHGKIRCVNGCIEEKVEIIKKEKIHFDYIVVSSLLHELEEPDALLEALHSIAYCDTVIHINVPNAYSIHRLIAKGMGMMSDVHNLSEQQKIMQRHAVYDIPSLCEYVTSHGFRIAESGSFFPKFLTGAQLDKALEKKIIDESIFDGIDSISEYLDKYGSEIYVQVQIEKV